MKFLAAREILLALTLAILLASCASTDTYPQDWPAVISGERGDCSALVGAFNNGYAKSTPDAIRMKGGLIALLIGSASSKEADGALPVTWLKIEQPSPDRLTVTGYNGKRAVRRGNRPLERGSCSKKGLSISGKFEGVNAENVVGFLSASGHLQRAENGDLVARIRSTFTGVALLVPVTSSATSWYRFRRIDSTPAPADTVQ
jgi:hypothetical protein